MLISDRLQEAYLNTKVIYMIGNSFLATCGHKTKYLNWHYPFLWGIDHPRDSNSALRSLCWETVDVMVTLIFQAGSSLWDRDCSDKCGTGTMLLQVALKVVKLCKAIRTSERRHKVKGQQNRDLWLFLPQQKPCECFLFYVIVFHSKGADIYLQAAAANFMLIINLSFKNHSESIHV